MNTGYAPFRLLPQAAKHIKEFQHIRKKYRSPCGFLPWDQYAAAVCLELDETVETPVVGDGYEAWSRHGYWVTARYSVRAQSPAYFVGSEILAALRETPVDVREEDFPPVLPSFSLFFPRGSLPFTDGSGRRFNCLAALFIDLRTMADFNKTSGKHLATAWILAENEESTMRAVLPCPIRKTGDAVSPFWPDEVFSRVVFGCYLGLIHRQFEITEESVTPGKAMGFGKSNDPQPLPCRWIGKNFRIARQPSPDWGGTHASPQAHWRRGHWHRVRHGQGKQEVKLLWYQPVFVGA